MIVSLHQCPACKSEPRIYSGHLFANDGKRTCRVMCPKCYFAPCNWTFGRRHAARMWNRYVSKKQKLLLVFAKTPTPQQVTNRLWRIRFFPPISSHNDIRRMYNDVIVCACSAEDMLVVPVCAFMFGGKYLEYAREKAMEKRKSKDKVLVTWFNEAACVDWKEITRANNNAKGLSV